MPKSMPANPHPCSECPWRIENHGKPHPHGWNTKKNRTRLWSKLRRGEPMSCHNTDPSNPVPPGAKVVPAGHDVYECTGALILQQREVMEFQKVRDIKKYRQERPMGMTKEGLRAIVNRALFGGAPILGELEMSKPDLNQSVSVDGEKWEP